MSRVNNRSNIDNRIYQVILSKTDNKMVCRNSQIRSGNGNLRIKANTEELQGISIFSPFRLFPFNLYLLFLFPFYLQFRLLFFIKMTLSMMKMSPSVQRNSEIE